MSKRNYFWKKIKLYPWPRGFKLLYLLIVVDALATCLGLQMEVIEEANPVMAPAFHQFPFLTLFLKVLLSFLLLDFINTVTKLHKIKWPLHAVSLLNSLHIAVAVLHLRWVGIIIVLPTFA